MFEVGNLPPVQSPPDGAIGIILLRFARPARELHAEFVETQQRFVDCAIVIGFQRQQVGAKAEDSASVECGSRVWQQLVELAFCGFERGGSQ